MEELLKEAKLKALQILTGMDRTENQLREKLKQKDYPTEIVEQAIEYVKSFGYINDERYAQRYIEYRKTRKSKKELYMELVQKGIDKEQITNALNEFYVDEDEEEAIRLLAIKKRIDISESDVIEKKKFCDYLLRKGFSYGSVRKVLEVSSWNA